MAAEQRLPYRPCVGILLFNPENLVWIGRRIPKWSGDGSPQLWQLPQGGIDAGESPRQAAYRELEEEVGTANADIIAESPRWLTYDLPPQAVGRALKGRFGGQRQKWFAMRFKGSDAEIDIGERPGHRPEFDAWRWAGLDEIVGLVVPFKRSVYEALVAEFAPLISASGGRGPAGGGRPDG